MRIAPSTGLTELDNWTLFSAQMEQFATPSGSSTTMQRNTYPTPTVSSGSSRCLVFPSDTNVPSPGISEELS